MKHDEQCDCPIHIVEDTTNVKYAAWAVIAFFTGIFLFSMMGCTDMCDLPSIKREAESTCKARNSRVRKIFDMHCSQSFTCEDGYEYNR